MDWAAIKTLISNPSSLSLQTLLFEWVGRYNTLTCNP